MDKANEAIPFGFNLRHTLRGHKQRIVNFAWSPDGQMLATPSCDKTICLWDAASGQIVEVLTGHSEEVGTIAWSPDSRKLASGSTDRTVLLWERGKDEPPLALRGHTELIRSVTWSPDGQIIASSSDDCTVKLWDAQSGSLIRTLQEWDRIPCVLWSPHQALLATASDDGSIGIWDPIRGQRLRRLEGHQYHVLSLAWAQNGRVLASASCDSTVRIWDVENARLLHIIEGHLRFVQGVSFSFDDRFLASKSLDQTVKIWRCDNWELAATLHEDSFSGIHLWHSNLAFNPTGPVLATLGEEDLVVHIWDLDFDALADMASPPEQIHYTNTKVILVGDSGVGKTGLGLVLAGFPFAPTESTHKRNVWVLQSQELVAPDGCKETRETLLWDLAGQPGYRLIHQLHLDEVSVALIVFDARSETDPFAGVPYWDRALGQALRVQGDAAPPMKKHLVAARTDRGGVGASRERIEALVRERNFSGFFATSAKEGMGISELAAAIYASIAWDSLPRVSSTKFFQQIKGFLISEKESGRILSTIDDLYRTFLAKEGITRPVNDLRAQFETCIGRVESRGLIKRLSFGSLTLLQPELLDAYASAIVNAAKEEPDGLGCIAEADVLAGQFCMPQHERVLGKDYERLLLIATVEEMLRHEIVLREQTENGPILVFPSQFTREKPVAPEPSTKSVTFHFEGPILNIYATLAVRLSRSGQFCRQEMWKNAAVYRANIGGQCGIWLHELGDGIGEITTFFDTTASEETRFQFEYYIQTHLQRWSYSGIVTRRRIFSCPNCGTLVTEQQVELRRQRGYDYILCNVCENRLSILDQRFIAASSVVSSMDQAANRGREHDVDAVVIIGKEDTADFDVFISHSEEDSPWVRNWLIPHLQDKGLLVYTSQDYEVGMSVLASIERAVERCRRTLLVLTPHWLKSKWAEFENVIFQTTDPSGLHGRILPLMLEKCTLPKRLSMLVFADFTRAENQEHELERIKKALDVKNCW